MSNFTAVLDACVLFSASVRDTLLVQAESPVLYVPRWSEEILKETSRNLVKRRNVPEEKAERLINNIRAAFPESCVTGFDNLLPAMGNDPKDRHVLAAAVKCGAQSIVTFNIKDFPESALEPWCVEAQHPDEFLVHQFHLDPKLTIEKLHVQASRLKTQERQWTIVDVLKKLSEFTPEFVELVRSCIGAR